jgi:hypothetical protein
MGWLQGNLSEIPISSNQDIYLVKMRGFFSNQDMIFSIARFAKSEECTVSAAGQASI